MIAALFGCPFNSRPINSRVLNDGSLSGAGLKSMMDHEFEST